MPRVTRRRPSGREDRRDDVMQQFLTAIEKTTADGESLANVSIEQLAKGAGLSRATFYTYFSDKGELLRVWFESVKEELAASALDWWSIGAQSQGEDLRAALAQVVKTNRAHAPLIAALYDEATYDAVVREQVTGAIDEGVEALRIHIETGQGAGAVDSELLPGETAAWIGLMLERGLSDVVAPAGPKEVEKLIDSITDLVWHILYADSPSRRG